MGIFRRQNVWWIDYYANGQRMRERVGPSHRLAEDVLAKRKSEVAEGKFFPERKSIPITFAEAANTFWEQHAKYKKSGHSMKLRLAKLVSMFGNRRLVDITPLMVQEMRNTVKQNASTATANRYHAVLRAVFNRAKDWKLFHGENPGSIARLEKENPHRLRYLSEHEIRKLLLVCDSRILPIIVCALTTGMRRGEILNLKWLDVDFNQRLIYLTETKSGKAREIPIIEKLYALLSEMPHTSERVFDLPIITLRRCFDKALQKAEISGFRFHDLRHTFASHFIMRTGNLPALQCILGHSTPVMTQRYAHLSNSHLRDNMARLDSGWTPIWTPAGRKVLPAPVENGSIYNTNAVLCRGSSTGRATVL